MRRRILLSNQTNGNGTVDGSKANVLDVVFFNKSTSALTIVEGGNWSKTTHPKSEYEPIGIVVIPGKHGVLKDGSGGVNQCGVMSLVEMNYSTPEKGGTSKQSIYYGGYGTDITGKSDGLGRFDSYIGNGLQSYDEVCHVGNNGQINDTIQGTDEYAFLPSDNFTTVKNPYDSGTYYKLNDANHYAPSPYQNNGSYNPIYGQTTPPSSENNALSDFRGIVNTKIITDLAIGQSDWRTASTITNNSGSTYFPAACCCARFKTTGTKAFADCTAEELRKGAGFWYLPSIGELGYIMPRLKQIQQIISQLKTIYGVGVQLSDDFDTRTLWVFYILRYA